MGKTVQEVIVDNMRTMLEDAPTLLTVVETLASEGTKWVRQDVTIRSVRPSDSIKVTVVGSSSTQWLDLPPPRRFIQSSC